MQYRLIDLLAKTFQSGQDAPLNLTRRSADQLEQGLLQTQKALQQEYSLSHPPFRRYLVWVAGANSIEVTAELTPEALRNIPGRDLLQNWEQQTGAVEGSYSARFSAADELGGGSAIAISAPDRELARRAAKELKAALQKLPGVNNIYDDSQGGQRQAVLKVNQRGQQLGITQRQVATMVGASYGSLEVYRLLEKGEEIKVLLRFGDDLRNSLEQLQDTPVRVSDSRFVASG